MKWYRRFLLILLIFTFGFAQIDNFIILAADTQSNESQEIEVILNVDENVMKTYTEAFHKKYPDITVKYTKYSNYEEDIMKRIDSGDYGDVLFIPSSLDSEGVKTYLEPLGKCETLSEKYNFVENAYVIDDITYSLPSSLYLKGILYNKEVFDKAGISRMPKDQEEFLNDLKLIQERTDALPFYTSYEIDWVLNDWSFFPYIEMTGNTDYRGLEFVYEKNPFSSGSNFYESYKLLYNIVDQGLCEKEPLVSDWGELCKKVNNGEIAAVVVGTWSYDQMKYAGENTDSIAYMPFPNEIDGKQYATIGVDYGYCISKNSMNKEAARKFIEYMLDESGYAVDNDRISIVKTDPLPDIYSKIDNLEVEISKSRTDQTSYYYDMLSSDIDPESAEAIREVIDAAKDKSKDFDNLMESWNTRWENARPANMKTHNFIENSNAQGLGADNIQNFIMNNYEVEYSMTEREYIKEKKNIIVGYLAEMAPFQYQEKNLDGTKNFVGLSRIICESVQESTKMEFTYVPFENCEEMIEALNNGKIDLAAGIASDEKNAENVKLSKSYLELSNVILKSDALDLDELSGKKEAYLTGSELNIDLSTESKKVSYKSISKLVDAIDKKRVDFAVLNYYSANYYVKEGEYTYTALVPLTEKADYCLAFSKDVDTRLVSICNKCIYSFPEESIQMTLMQYMDPQVKKITLKRYIIANPVQCSIFVLVFLVFIFGVIYIIKREKEENRKKHEVDTKRYEILSQLTDEYVFEYEYSTGNIHFDEKFSEKFGFENDVNISEFTNDNSSLSKFMIELCKDENLERTNNEPFELVDSKNNKQWYRMIAYSVMGDKQRPQHIIGKLVNVQQMMEEKKKIEKEADRDFLTSLYNRTGFEKRINELAEINKKAKSEVFAVLDLDNFKLVNDSLGHLGGDKALVKLATELKSIPNEKIITSRYGGDEFVICMFDIAREEAEEIFSNLVSKMNCTMTYEGKNHVLSISLGAVYSNHIEPLEVMFVEADKILYEVKTLGKNNYKFIDYMEE